MEHIFTDKTFEADVLRSDKPVLVDFWAPWCGPCRMMAPVIAEIAEEVSSIKVGKLNVDDEPDTAAKYNVMSIPTFILFKDGTAAKRVVGGQTKEELLREMQVG
jgi:thioredoxin 1